MISSASYFRPLVQVGAARPQGAKPVAGGWCWFTHVEVLSRNGAPQVVSAVDVPGPALSAITAPRPKIAQLSFDAPILMGVLNTTPDSFSDGGRHATTAEAVAVALEMQAAGAQIIDVGGESTRPGAATVAPEEEISRVVPVIQEATAAGLSAPISIDTRKAVVAKDALAAGATMINDVSGFTYDPALVDLAAQSQVPICVMHALGDPKTMQANPYYDDVLLDVFDFLKAQIAALVARGIAKERIIADPGIGFGKTLEHNLSLLSRLSLFHGLGVPILLGASRKRFIGTIGQVSEASRRGPGSIGVALAALGQGVQILRVHDVADTAQAIALWRAAVAGQQHG
ncbi:MAG: dihydropteroate synthase [Pseudomonadota bacterium]